MVVEWPVVIVKKYCKHISKEHLKLRKFWSYFILLSQTLTLMKGYYTYTLLHYLPIQNLSDTCISYEKLYNELYKLSIITCISVRSCVYYLGVHKQNKRNCFNFFNINLIQRHLYSIRNELKGHTIRYQYVTPYSELKQSL